MSSQQGLATLTELVRESVLDPNSSLLSRAPEVELSPTLPSPPTTWSEVVLDTEPPIHLLVAMMDETSGSASALNPNAGDALGPFFSVLARRLGALIGKKISPSRKSPAEPPETPVALVRVRLDQSEIGFVLGLSQAELARLGRHSLRPSQPASAFNPVLDALMDVELPVTLVLGTRQIPLAQALQLNAGSLVELETNLGDPVDVIVNNRVVARGDVVAVGGNYAVRISEILSDSSVGFA